MLKRRIFIAINFPEDFKKRIIAFQEKWGHLPVRWIKAHNLHLTVVPPIYLDDDEIARVVKSLGSALKAIEPFEIEFERFLYAPPGKPARMIWLLGKSSQNLIELKRLTEDAILSADVPFRPEEKHLPLKPHITVARMVKEGYLKSPQFLEDWQLFDSKPEIEEVFETLVPVSSVEAMESVLQRGGAEYSVLESVELGK